MESEDFDKRARVAVEGKKVPPGYPLTTVLIRPHPAGTPAVLKD